MNTLGNIIWFIFGGFIVAVEYVIAGILLMITIVGIPFGVQAIKLADLALWPFGRDVRSNEFASGCLGAVMNVIWIIFGGIWIFFTHIIFGLLLTITIIGIPFGRQHFKLARISLTPFGSEIYRKER